jgi:putrescine aminotransferase
MREDVPRLLHSFARPAAGREKFLEIVAGEGAEVIDASGRRYVDALGSLWYCNVGHGRREIADAVSAQMARLEAFHTFERFTNAPAEMLAERISGLAPMPDTRVFLTSGGSEAVETAVKLSRVAQAWAGHPERTVVVSRRPSYHGVTYAALSATGIAANQEGFGPLLPDVVQVPYDDLEALDRVGAEHAGRVAAVIAEPVVGAGGVYPPPDGYFAGLRERCDSWGAYLIVDEVICGFGRLGRWWGSEYYGVRPDLVTFAKGVTSGYLPVGGVIVGTAVRDVLESDDSAVLRHGYTYGGHPTGAAAALANLDLLEKESLVGRAPLIADRLGAGLAGLVDGDRIVACRGAEGIWALELAERLSAPAVRDSLLDHGVIVRPIGASILAYCPPLVVTDEQMDRCVEATRVAVALAPE